VCLVAPLILEFDGIAQLDGLLVKLQKRIKA
jgi:hypothetical protein